jgi:hypothetical protein
MIRIPVLKNPETITHSIVMVQALFSKKPKVDGTLSQVDPIYMLSVGYW